MLNRRLSEEARPQSSRLIVNEFGGDTAFDNELWWAPTRSVRELKKRLRLRHRAR